MPGYGSVKMRILQFTSMQDPALTARLVRATRRAAATVVLDLEDSLWDVLDDKRTPGLKEAGRANLVALARADRALFSGQPIGVRVNRVTGPYAGLDFEALGRASRHVEFECIVPTKVESAADIHANLSGLRAARVAHRGLVPIVETRLGLANLEEILEAAAGAGVEWLIYGHFDHALDCGLWPFPEPDEDRYWDAVEPLVRRFESAGLGYVHPPYFQTRDEAGMTSILARLARTCAREFGVLTVGPRQTVAMIRLFGEIRSGHGASVRGGVRAQAVQTNGTPADQARHVMETFIAARRHSSGIALDRASGEFISPHVYLAARDYLRRTAHA